MREMGGMNKGFQFLMVRLKVSKRHLPDRRAHISIPYGAIKRKEERKEKKEERNFNSLWCD